MQNKDLEIVFTQVPKEINTKPINSVEKEVACACCETPLVKVIEIKDISVKSDPEQGFVLKNERTQGNMECCSQKSNPTKFKFSCPFCGKYSFIHTFEHKVYFQPLNCKISSIEEDSEKWLVKLF